MADLNDLGAKPLTGSPIPPQYIHGEAIGPYRILQTLGTGGMGVVYRSVHDKTGEQVAIKTICIANEAVVESIHREIHALARIHHPGIVQVLARNRKGQAVVCDATSRGIMLHGLLDVRELDSAKRLRRTTATIYSPTEPRARIATSSDSDDVKSDKDLDRTGERRSCDSVFGGVETTLTDVLTIVRETCSALSFLHGEGIVHGDLKPENILLDEQRHPVIIDFGPATQFEGRLSLTLQNASGQVSGTLPYISPEMLQGSLMDARADLYAVGCILY